MGIGDGIAQGIQAGQMLFRPITDRFAEKRRLAQEMQMFNAKNQAELAQHLALKKADHEFTQQQRQMALESLAKRFGGQETPETPQAPSLDQITQIAQSQAPQAPKIPSMEAFNHKKWQAENYQDFLDPDTGRFDEKGFRQGLKNASDEYQNQQYLKSQNIDLPVSMLKSPFVGDIIKTKQEARKLEKDKNYVIEYAKRNGLKLSTEEIEAYASRPGVIEAIQSNKEQERRFAASEAHRAKSEANAEARLAKYLAPKASGGGGTSGYRQTRDGNFVKVDRRGNPTGQIIRARDAYNMGITNVDPRQSRPRPSQAPIPAPNIKIDF